MWKILYNFIAVPFFWLIIRFLSLFNKKIRRGIRGRINLFHELETKMNSLSNGKRILIHSSSMGEFEQAKPIILLFKEKYPNIKIIVSFFSPSGYENNLKYKLADIITYMPFDSYRNAKKFVRLIKPDICIFMRYDIWPNHLWMFSKMGIPSFIVDATMSKNSNRQKPIIKSFHKNLFRNLKGILAVSVDDAREFEAFDCVNGQVQVVGDTRYDQVYGKSLIAKEKHLFPQTILKNKKVFIVGSSWNKDEEIIIPIFKKLKESIPELVMILVPHEPNEPNLEYIETELRNESSFIRFSQLLDYKNEDVIIIDCIGLLLSLYAYAHCAYVGGGFGDGIHNVLEPATYGIPVIFGPRNKNSQEAQKLIEAGSAFEIANKKDLESILSKMFFDEDFRIKTGKICSDFVKQNLGADEKILNYFENYLKN